MTVPRRTLLVAAVVACGACAAGPRRYNVYVEASAGLAAATLDGEGTLGPTVGAHFGIAKETEHSDGFNAHMGPSLLTLLDGSDWRAVLAMLSLHLDHTTSRSEDGSHIRRWATIIEGPALWLHDGDDVPATAAVSVATGPAREWRAHGFLAGAGILARGLVGGRSVVGGGLELRLRIGIADRPRPPR